MIYTGVSPEIGSNVLACVLGTSTCRSRYSFLTKIKKLINSFYIIKYKFILNWLYNLAPISSKVRWVFL